MQSIYTNSFPDFPAESEVWVYAADRFLTNIEVEQVQNTLDAFTRQWKTHGKDLRADAKVFDSVFVIFATDINVGSASGCSIDTSVRLMKQIGTELNVDFFNRLKMVVNNTEGLKHVSYHDLNQFVGSHYADISVKSLGQLKDSFFVPIHN